MPEGAGEAGEMLPWLISAIDELAPGLFEQQLAPFNDDLETSSGFTDPFGSEQQPCVPTIPVSAASL